MSRANGEKARANLQKRRRTLQRAKDRAAREALASTASPAPAPATKKPSKRGA